ncbi:MAG: hypothetical protein Tsb002_06610 [Wenzhouxiangellaceae bacterium]
MKISKHPEYTNKSSPLANILLEVRDFINPSLYITKAKILKGKIILGGIQLSNYEINS